MVIAIFALVLIAAIIIGIAFSYMIGFPLATWINQKFNHKDNPIALILIYSVIPGLISFIVNRFLVNFVFDLFVHETVE